MKPNKELKKLAHIACADLINAFLQASDWPEYEGTGNLFHLDLSEKEIRKIREYVEAIVIKLYDKGNRI